MRRILPIALVVLCLPVLVAADWTKAYFAATKPGTWAKHRLTSTSAQPSTTTYTRMPDENGQIVIDQFSEFSDKHTPASTMRYHLEAGFNADRELIDFLAAITSASAQSAPMATSPTSPPIPSKRNQGEPDLPRHRGVQGRRSGSTARTATAMSTPASTPAQIETGELCLNASVPFGLVKQTISIHRRVAARPTRQRSRSSIRATRSECDGPARQELFVIQVTNVVKRYGPATVLNSATFRIADSQLTTIVGPSGCGKSTMLRCLNRLERFDKGRIEIDDIALCGAAEGSLSPAEEDALVHRVRERVGLVFQNFNLFPAPDRARQRHRIADDREEDDAQAQAEGAGRHYLESGRAVGQGAALPGAALRWPAAARRHRPRARDGADVCSSTNRRRRSIHSSCAKSPSCCARSTT